MQLESEMKASTDALLKIAERDEATMHERRTWLMDMLEQCNHMDAPALAMHHLRKAAKEGVIPLASALPLAKLYAARIQLDVERMQIDFEKDDVRALMSICAAPYTK
jgi:hypothetical protein